MKSKRTLQNDFNLVCESKFRLDYQLVAGDSSMLDFGRCLQLPHDLRELTNDMQLAYDVHNAGGIRS